MINQKPINSSRKRNKKRMRTSYLRTGLMVVGALAALAAAIWVVMTVYEKIAGDTNRWTLETTAEETTAMEIQAEEKFGWITDETGSRYREDDGTFAADTWKIWKEGLYYLKEDTYMAREDFRMDGQVFSVDSEGKLQDIQLDTGWTGLTGDDNPDHLDSLVKSHVFWAYRSPESTDTGLFKPVYYRKTTEMEGRLLGDPSNPELSTKNSLHIYGDYLYFLPQVTSGSINSLSTKEQDLVGKLYRMKPGSLSKEQLAENVTGYLVLEDGTIYCASRGEIRQISQTEIVDEASKEYTVKVQDSAVYLTDGTGAVVTGGASGTVTYDGRVYHLSNGEIKYVLPAEVAAGGMVYTLEAKDSSGEKAIFRKSSDGTKEMVAECAYGIDSFCAAGNDIYYSAYEDKENSTRYSRIYRIRNGESQGTAVGKRFEGNILNLYYYGNKNKIYGEYTPVSWKNCYTKIAVISMDGSMSVIDDNQTELHQDTDANELLELLMVDGDTVTCYLKTCSYDRDSKSWKVLSQMPYQFSDQDTTVLFGKTAVDSEEETREDATGEEETESGDSTTASETDTTGKETAEETRAHKETVEETRAHKETTEETRAHKETQAETQAAETTRASEPGFAPPSPPTTEAPGPGNTTSSATIEANPESGNGVYGGPGAPSSDSVQYIGPGGN